MTAIILFASAALAAITGNLVLAAVLSCAASLVLVVTVASDSE